MAEPGEKLTGKQGALLTALLCEPSIAEAAKAAGVGERTAFRYLADPAFQAEYRAARRELVEQTVARLQADGSRAARVLREIAEDATAPASARVTAARTIIEQGFSGAKLQDLAEEIEQIKAMLAGQEKRRGPRAA
jgi:molybdenum-dependent DNA-binding transcriptional regulator ModE